MRLNGFIEHNNIIDGEQEGFGNFTAQRQLCSDLFKAYTTDLTTEKIPLQPS